MYSHNNLNHSSLVFSVSWQPLSDIGFHSLVRHLKAFKFFKKNEGSFCLAYLISLILFFQEVTHPPW